MRVLDSTMSEAELQASVIELARLTGWRYYHTHDSRRSPHGFPDLILVRLGRMIVAELKSARGVPTPAQEAWLDDLALVQDRSGGVVEVRLWRPADWSSGEIEARLK